MATISGEVLSQAERQICIASFAQEHYWILDQLEPGSTLLTMTARVQVSKLLSSSVLQTSLNLLIERYEVLRTTFHMQQGQLLQAITPHLHLPLSVIDLREMSPNQQYIQVQQHTASQAQPPFTLSSGPLLRCTLLHLAAEQSILLLCLHPIVCDARSLGLLVQELACLYDACASEQPSPLPSPARQYADFAAQQRRELSEQLRTQHQTYWRQQMIEAPAAVSLPTDHLRTAGTRERIADFQVMLPGRLTQALRDLSQEYAVSLEVILLTAWLTLLSRYTDQQDLIAGTVLPAQQHAETEALIGPCESTLALRADLSGGLSFSLLLQRVQESIQAASQHMDLPLESLLSGDSLGQQPLFSVLLRLPCPQPPLPAAWTLSQVDIPMPSSAIDLMLDLQEQATGLLARFFYRSDLFEQTTIGLLATHWQTLLEGIVAEPDRPPAQLPLLTSRERHHLLVTWNATQKTFASELAVVQQFEAQVQLRPLALAVCYEGQQLSYQQLNQQANQLAHHLLTQGVGPETLVALLAERGLPLLIAILAVFKAGAAYLPLDPHHPSARLRGILEQSNCSLVLTTASSAPTLRQALEDLPPQARPTSLLLEQTPHHSDWDENLPALSQPEHLAYVIYTSGSTGLPKGAMVEQRGMRNHLWAKIEALSLTEADIVAQTASQCFDISVWQFLAALLVGGQVRIYPDAVAHDARLLLERVEHEQVSILETVPSLLRTMLDALPPADQQSLPMGALRWLIPTGEALPVELGRRWLERYPHVPLLNAYGPTECSDDVTHYVLSQPPEQGTRSIPIGRAIPNLRLYVLDRSLHPTPIGVTGELYVGGIGVGRGYLGDERRTTEAFVPDPFVPTEGARLYKTGDLVRYLPDGNLEFIGRVDSQVKVRGNRIELGEIEALLSMQAGVQAAVVVAYEERPGEQQLVAYIVLHQEQSVTMEELKRRLMQQVPDYMVPSAFLLLEKLPLTDNGKLDRKALPAPEQGRTEQQRYVPPVHPLHRQLAVIWEDLLGVRPIGIQDDFFELGGNSLLAVQLFERIEQVCGKRLSLSTLFAGASIEQVATALQEENQGVERAALVVVQAGGSRRPFFFLHGQWRGGAFYSRELARHMGPEQPFYLLEPYKFDGQAVPATLEQMATAHLETLRRVQPEGPYLLGGWCNGGLMAYEMARQLHAQGQSVELLVMMDADAPATPFKRGYQIIKIVGAGLGKLLRLSPEKPVDWFLLYRHLRLSFHYWRLRTFKRTATHNKPELEPGLAVDDESPELDTLFPEKAALRRDWLGVLDWATSGYMPHSYPGKITFFWAEEEGSRQEKWRKVIEAKFVEAKELDIQIIPGNHITSRTQHLPILAEHLRACLNGTPSTSSS